MFEHLTINYGLNYSYNLSKKVFEQVVVRASQIVEGVQIENIIVTITHSSTNVAIDFSFKIAKDKFLNLIILDLKNKIEEYVINLIDIPPTNIKMIYKGRI